MKYLILVLCCLIIPLKITISQSEYGESYEESYEYYEEPTDSDYYYGDYGEDSESEEESTEDPYPSRWRDSNDRCYYSLINKFTIG